LNALVLECRTAQHRLDLTSDGTRADTQDDLLFGQFAVFQILIHQILGCLGSRLDQLAAPLVGSRHQISRDLLILELHTLGGFIPDDRSHLDQIHNACETFFSADRNHQRDWIGTQTRLHLSDDLEEVRAGTVHLVDERQTRNFVFVSLTPNRLGLWLHTTYRAIHHTSAIQHAHRTLNFDREVNVPRRIDDVETMLWVGVVHAFPETGRCSGSDGDTALLLLLHPVHRGRTIVHLTDLVAHTRIEQDALGSGCLTCINVRTDADVAIAVDWCFACHDKLPK
jgi:hypothetical protein